MPAISEAQMNFFRLVNAYKKGGLKKSQVSKDVVATAKEMSKKQIADYLTMKKRSMHEGDDTLEDIDPSYEVYEDITMEDVLKFKAILDMLDIEPNEEGHLIQGRRTIRL
jgi:hypothetical protein